MLEYHDHVYHSIVVDPLINPGCYNVGILFLTTFSFDMTTEAIWKKKVSQDCGYTTAISTKTKSGSESRY